MPSIFPGIDPYVEAQHLWPDFHVAFAIYFRDAITALLPDSYHAWIRARIVLEEGEMDRFKLMRPVSARGGATVAELEVEPTTIPMMIPEVVKERYIEIVRRPDRSVVTVIELLSPDNKAEPGFGQDLAKRAALLYGTVHLVELDFLLRGHRLPMAGPLPAGDAYAFVARGDRRPDCEVYAWSIRRPLSAIRIPLLAPDPDLRLDLAAVYATAFAKGRYDRVIDYSAPLALPLSPEDRAWAEELARPRR